ncbi:hypothetical protein [Streptomyces sp. NBC_01262]|uniref:hypothetical protein n=1 Tax=Streptomyces sp. NBC_01262 TaxID=2903803 RepID=UPI002E2EC991|nr:hypothetical protein [Streptomyces sp. NBC_01262]
MASQAGSRAVAYHPAGPDTALRAVWSEVEAGRWRAMRDLLLDTRKAIPNEGWARWSQRTQVLGMLAAGSNVVETWWAEERGVEAAVMLARVRSHRAVSAYRALRVANGPLTVPQLGDVERLAAAARSAIWAAEKWHPVDPVLPVCRLSLALADESLEHSEHRWPPPDQFLPRGPWGLYQRICDLDPPHNREAAHWILKVLTARGTSPYTVGNWAASVAHRGSDMHALPLYAAAQAFRDRQLRESNLTQGWFWNGPLLTAWTQAAYSNWFCSSPSRPRGLPGDLNHLAHALKTCGMHTQAHYVFEEIGPHITPSPWRDVIDDPDEWQEEFERARSYCARWAY